MDFIDKKEELTNTLENYISSQISKEELITKIKQYNKDEDFNNKQLFTTIFDEIINYIDELPRRQIKQRMLMIKDFLE